MNDVIRPSLLPDHSEEGTLGGKAFNLFILTRNGIPVPRWMCIPAEAFETAVTPVMSRIRAVMDSADFHSAADLERVHAAAREIILGLEFPPQAADALRSWLARTGAPMVAVRSSAVGEDSARDSFAGMFDTYLYTPQDQIIPRVKECWASAFSPRILSYLKRKGKDPMAARVGVIVQEMIASHVAGVMFQANPHGPITETVIVAGYGLGEGIVSDLVETDTFHVDTRTGTIRSHIAQKRNQVVFDDVRKTGTRTIAVPPGRENTPALSEDQIRELLRVSERIRTLFDHFQDIEWAFDRTGRLFITQSRAITTIPRGPQSIFDNSNIVEGYPGITLPLTFSYIRSAYETIFRNIARRLGVPQSQLLAQHTLFQNMVGYIDGRVYYALHNWYRVFNLLPIGRLYAPSFERMAGIKEKAAPLSGGGFRLRDIPGHLRFFTRLLHSFLTLETLMQTFKRTFQKEHQRFRTLDLSRMTNHQLITEYHALFFRLMHGWEVTLLFDMFAVIFSSLAKALLKRFGLEDRLFNDLLCAEEGMESVEPVRALVHMAEIVREDARLHACLKDLVAGPESDRTIQRFLADTRFPGFCEALRTYLDRYGDRAIEELKLESTVYRDSPTALIRTLLAYVPLDLTSQGMQAHERAIREAAERQLTAVLGRHPVRRRVFDFVIRHARQAVLYRESSRLDRARAFAIVRQIFTRIGMNLRDEGVLDAPDDIFYLTMEEIGTFIFGNSANAQLKWIVAERRRQQDEFQRKKPAERLVLQGTVYANHIPQVFAQAETAAAGSGIIRGTGCCPGIVTAEAMIVRDPKTAIPSQGKILVAEMTDPGWVFLMIAAKGLIVEKGSLLSHTAIIGRELGIPTIVGVQDAIKSIPDGCRIRMNGQTGEIELHVKE